MVAPEIAFLPPSDTKPFRVAVVSCAKTNWFEHDRMRIDSIKVILLNILFIFIFFIMQNYYGIVTPMLPQCYRSINKWE
jgi:hypothetical protein